MGQLKLPAGVEGAFRIEWMDAFGDAFTINVYGAGKEGWFVAWDRHAGRREESGVRQLPKGEWPTLLHLIDHCGFWGLPEGDEHLVPANETVDDGSFLTISGRIGERYHRIHRFVWRERGLDALHLFGQRVSGLYTKHPRWGWVTTPPSDPAGG